MYVFSFLLFQTGFDLIVEKTRKKQTTNKNKLCFCYFSSQPPDNNDTTIKLLFTNIKLLFHNQPMVHNQAIINFRRFSTGSVMDETMFTMIADYSFLFMVWIRHVKLFLLVYKDDNTLVIALKACARMKKMGL